MIPFFGYEGQVWGVVYASFQYFLNKLGLASNPGTVVPLAETVYQTAGNALEALNIYRISNAWVGEYNLLLQAEGFPITVTAQQSLYFSNRTAALDLAILAINQILPTISLNAVGPLLDQNEPTISDPNFLLWLEAFNYETPPIGLSSSIFVSNSQDLVNSFTAVAVQIGLLQGFQLTQVYDAVIRFANTAQIATNIMNDFTSGPLPAAGLNYNLLWNQIVTVPALLLDAFLISSAPYTIQVQQDMVIRYLLLMIRNELALFLLIMRSPLTSSINQAILRTGDSLMDVAARNTGNFENWATIAAANGLLPPYVGSTSSPGIAGWGSELILPNPGTTTSAVGVTPSYDINYLGVDEYIGPINGQMPPWTGDYNTIQGLLNLRWALGRRVQTTYGALIYHSTYGCRIPPEVGNIQDANTVGRIAAFGRSAIQQDPRVATVLAAFAQSLPNFAVAFQAYVQPGGFGSTALEVNETLSPTTAPLADAT